MEQILDKFRSACQEPYQRLKDWKSTSGKKIIGCMPMYIPEEIIHAAGMLPVIILDGEPGPITLANEHLQANTCEQVRGALDVALKGKLDYLDGIVFSDICDPLQYLAGIWKAVHPMPYFHVLDIPHKLNDTGKEFLLTVWRGFKASLEEFSGSKITDRSLSQSIEIYNQNRALLRRLYDLRQANPGLITAGDICTIVEASMLMPKEEHSQWLSKLLAQLEGAGVKTGEGIKLMLAGNLCDKPHEDVLALIEELGAVIVDDEIYTGGRYFATDVAQSGDPLEALADHYINMVPCTSMHYPENYTQTVGEPGRDYARYLIDRFKASGAKGLIVLMIFYCDPYSFKYPSFSENLTEAGVPFLMIETEHEMGSLEPIRTRLQAFLEMIGV